MVGRPSISFGNPERVPTPSRDGLRRAKPGSVGAMGKLGATALLVVSAAACRQTVLFDGKPDAGSGPDGGAAFCPGGEARRLTFEIEAPEVIVAVDRSTSMNAVFGEASRVSVARDVIEAAVARFQTVTRFGHVDFPGRPCGDGQSCCRGDLTPPTSSFDAFRTALRTCAAQGSSCASSSQRPLAAALEAANETFERLGWGDRRAVLVLTDGPPSCGACEDAAIEAAVLAADEVSTHIVAVGSGSGSDCLQAIARVGLTRVESASSPDTLRTVVEEILGHIARTACRIDVSSTPDQGEEVSLLHHGLPLPQDDRNGWAFENDSRLSISLHGEACQLLLDQGPESFDLRACRPPP